jgi:hypothetical protein
MSHFFETVVAVCLANYMLAVIAVASRRWSDKRAYKKWAQIENLRD